jgi:diadenosine tetraphosphatase ApaH/serine/threonine PP2A family protein phosphatase
VPVAFIDDAPGLKIVDPEAGTVLALDERATLVNPGSVGQPRDGDPRASYLLLDVDEQVVTWRRVAYDIPAVQGAIRAAGLPRRLADRLAVGA